MIKNINTKMKLLLFPFMFVIIVVVAGFIYVHYSGVENSRNQVAIQTEEFVQQLLKGRISVYQFLRAPTDANKQKVIDNFKTLDDSVIELRAKLVYQKNIELSNEILASSKEYVNNFNAVALKIVENQNNGIKEETEQIKNTIGKGEGTEKVSILEDVDFELELIHKDEINVAYILKLLAKYKDSTEDEKQRQRDNISNILTNNPQLRSKKELIEKFINENLYSINEDDIEDEFDKCVLKRIHHFYLTFPICDAVRHKLELSSTLKARESAEIYLCSSLFLHFNFSQILQNKSIKPLFFLDLFGKLGFQFGKTFFKVKIVFIIHSKPSTILFLLSVSKYNVYFNNIRHIN